MKNQKNPVKAEEESFKDVLNALIKTDPPEKKKPKKKKEDKG